MKCAACNSPDLRRLFSAVSPDGLIGKGYEILKCGACGLGRTYPAPTPAELSVLYSADYHEPGKARRLDAFVAFFKRLFLAHRFDLAKAEAGAGAMLDYGCGNGEFVEYSRSRGTEALGIEPNYASSSRFVKNSIAELPSGARYGLITLWHVLEHIESPEEELRALSRILAPNGRIFISVPNFSSWEALLGGPLWFHLDAPRHIWHYTPDSLKLTAEKSGLKVIKISFSFGFYGVFGMLQTMLNAFGQTNFLYYSLKRGVDFRSKMSGPRYFYNLLCQVCLIPFLLPLSAALVLPASLLGRSGSMEAVCEKA